MDHGHMDHDMPGMGGSGPKCNMNVRKHFPPITSEICTLLGAALWPARVCVFT